MTGVIVEHFGRVVPGDRGALLKVTGIGDYAANSILCFVCGSRLALLGESTLSKVEGNRTELTNECHCCDKRPVYRLYLTRLARAIAASCG